MSKSNIKGANKKQRNAIKKACLENAKWLLLQANGQFKNGNYNLSTFLAITSYEESLKYGLLNSRQSELISDKEYNSISSYHLRKLLSKNAFIQIFINGDKLKQKYTLPKAEYFKKKAQQIIEKREKSLYVDFSNLKLNIPTQMNPADAVEEINRAYKSIQQETSYEILGQKLDKTLKEIKSQ